MQGASVPDHLDSPHIPLRTSLDDGLAILRVFGNNVEQELELEQCFKIKTASFQVAIYPRGSEVGSIWYDDPAGRDSPAGRERKVQLYLERYGPLANWELRLNNGWMRYWFNPKDGAAMVYGIHNDVIRFNQYDENHA